MNKQILITAGLAIAFFGSIYRIAVEMGSLSLIHNSGYLLLLGFVPMIMTIPALIKYVKRSFEGYEVIQYVGISIMFFTVISQALVLTVNRFGPERCEEHKVIIQKIEPRYVSAYGHIKSEAVANRWEVSMTLQNGESRVVTLKSIEKAQEINDKTLSVIFCNSLFGFERYAGVKK